MTRHLSLCFVIVCVAAIAFQGTEATNTDNANLQDVIDRHLKHIDNNRQTLSLLQQLIQDMDQDMQQVRKRTCYFNAGMSHSCDYKEVIGAVDEANYWSSEMSPGRRKRFSTQQYPKAVSATNVWTKFLYQPNNPRPSQTGAESSDEPAIMTPPAWKPESQDSLALMGRQNALGNSQHGPEQLPQ